MMTEHDDKPDVARRKRTDEIAHAIKDNIIEQNLGPGDRLPQEKDLINQFAAGKSTVREALKSLEVQGLIRTRTGPGGGAFIETMSESRAMSLLSNYLFGKNISIADIYALRKALEPLVAESAIGRIDEAGFARLEALIAVYDHEPADNDERWRQRMAELDFHSLVASYSDNSLLAFMCRFLQRLLKELAICKDIYLLSRPVVRHQGIEWQRQLIAALRDQDGPSVHRITTDHMQHAEQAMLGLQATLTSQFLHDE
ncbi:FadR family transcriptional regulator [Chimaeribacter californicus]|uniref:FadR family transcriptional regulator n=1 Tax=Chimaeribacter californicus TaxID=2060067 RepID=A0A2N5E3T3_9GAMM|nr:GntR family transcriptional regulator [Chimaeribacter californicus]PLR35486.1 FadR family transcriptional regulator [Chimaeribacter californicus]